MTVHDPGRVTGTLAGSCQARDHGRLPDRRCTPGAIDPAVTQADIASTICVSGYTQTIRPPESQTVAFKFGQAYPAYGLASGTESELDHLVPLELGASVSSSSPADYTTVDIYVRTAAGTSVTTVARYKTTDHQKTAMADGAGQATVAYYISGATPGYTVTVDVTASAGSRTANCSTSFTPMS